MTATKASSAPPLRVLLLDDDPAWRQALADMYRSIIGGRGDVSAVGKSDVAERLLRDRAVDVFSLDLNLAERRVESDAGPLLCDMGRLQLIEAVARRRWATSLVLITREDSEEGRFIVCDEDRLNEAMVSPDEFVRRRFGEGGLVLNKPPRWDLPTSIARFEELIRRRLPELARAGYTLRFGGTIHAPRVTIESGREAITAMEGADAILLSALVIAGRAAELLSDRSVIEIYRGRDAVESADELETTRLAQREIDSLRRRLRRQGIDDRALIHRVRRSTTGSVKAQTGAWRLDGAVTTEGMSTLNIRARGGRDFRPDVPAED